MRSSGLTYDPVVYLFGFSPYEQTDTAVLISSFKELPEGWDYGEGRSISEEIVNKALAWESYFSGRGWTTNAGPGTDGEIAVSTTLGETRIEIVLEPDQTITVIQDFRNRRQSYEPRLSAHDAQKRISEIVETAWNSYVFFTLENMIENQGSGMIQHFVTPRATGVYLLSTINAYNQVTVPFVNTSKNIGSTFRGLSGSQSSFGSLTHQFSQAIR